MNYPFFVYHMEKFTDRLFSFRLGLLRLRPPQVRHGLPRNGFQRMRGRSGEVPRENRRVRRPKPSPTAPYLTPPMLRRSERTRLKASDSSAMELRRFSALPSLEHAAAFAGFESRTHREFEPSSTSTASDSPPEHAPRPGAFRRVYLLCSKYTTSAFN